MPTPFRFLIALLLLAGAASAADLRPEERAALAAFDHELASHAAARATRAVVDPARLRKVARERRVVLRRLVREDPEQALAVALDRARRELVPAGVRDELEQEVSALGALEVRVAQGDATQPPLVKREAVVAGFRYEVATWGAGLRDGSAVNRSLHGVVVDGVLALAPGRLRVLKAGERPLAGKRLDDQRCAISGKLAGADQEPDDGLQDVVVESGGAVHVLCQGGHITHLGDAIALAEAGSQKLASAYTTGTKKVLYLIAKCADEAGYPQVVANADSMMSAVGAYYQETSWGLTSMTWEIREIDLPKTKAEYAALDNGDLLLLSDARAAATAAGYALVDWHFDVVRHSSIFGGWAGQGYVGGKGSWLQSSSVGVAVHELGHNYGLWHANFWNTSNGSVIGAGANQEYGDPYSVMGSSGNMGQFTTYEKWRLDWIPTANTQAITASGTYRVHSSDSTTAPQAGKLNALRIVKDDQREYWVSHRRQFASGNRWVQDGVFLHWDPWSISGIGASAGGGHLLDCTPGSKRGKDDAALVRGRTFSDQANGIHITPMVLDTTTTPVSMQVVVNLGSFPGNRRPSVSMSASATSVANGADVSFSASASDPDGDALAVHWDFADDGHAANTLATSKNWSSSGEYPVRVTVSDMKGGTASATTLIRVGTVSTFRIAGVVRGPGGSPLQGVRVHHGATASSVWSDSDGSYTLANLADLTSYTVQAHLDGYTVVPDVAGAVTVGPSVTGKNFSVTNQAPTIAAPGVVASPATVTGKTSTLSLLGADDGGESALTYSWATTGPSAVVFASNSSNAARSTLATFAKAGSYPCQVTVTDRHGATVQGSITVTVNQNGTTTIVTPANPVVHVGAPFTFTATSLDQFNEALASQPTFSWSVSGGKSIAAGVVAASSAAGGPYTVTATGGVRSATTTFTVVNDAPTISALADQATAVDTGTGPIAVTIGDTETAAGTLTLTRASSNTTLVPAANVVLGGSGASRTVTATPASGQTGSTTITLTVADAHGGTATESFVLAVGAPLPAGGGGGDGGGGGGGGCGLGAGTSALLGLLALLALRHQRPGLAVRRPTRAA